VLPGWKIDAIVWSSSGVFVQELSWTRAVGRRQRGILMGGRHHEGGAGSFSNRR